MTDLYINPDKSPARIDLEQRYIDLRIFLSTELDPYEKGRAYAGLLVGVQTMSADEIRAEISTCVKLILSRH